MTSSSRPSGALDACCLLNLYASGRLVEVLKVQPFGCITSAKAASECGYVWAGYDERGELVRESVDLGAATASGLLQIVSLSSEADLDLFVEWAGRVDDGEAETIAVALSCGAVVVATDDEKARREIAARAAALRLVDTPSMMKTWSEVKGIGAAELGEALLAIERRGRFRPSPKAALADWWQASVSAISA